MLNLTSQKTEIAKSACEPKMTRSSCRRRTGEAPPRAEEFCGLITADRKVLSKEGESRNNHQYAVVVQDLATQWIQSYPCETKIHRRRKRVGKSFSGRHTSKVFFFSDNSLEFGKSCEDLSWNHRISTLHRSETNDTAERAVRRVKKGTLAVLLQSGLDEKWWLNLWNAVAICEMSKTSCPIGKLRTKDDLFEQWLNVT